MLLRIRLVLLFCRGSIKLNILWLKLLYHLLAHAPYDLLYSKLSYVYLQCTFPVFYRQATLTLWLLFYHQTSWSHSRQK